MAYTCLDYYYILLAKKDYSEKELRDKAKLKEFLPDDIERAITKVLDQNLLNDERLAENIVEKYSGQYGSRWILAKLIKRKISKDVIAGLKVYDEPDITYLKNKLNNKYSGHDQDTKIKNKAIGWLARRGFGDIYRLYDDIFSESGSSGGPRINI